MTKRSPMERAASTRLRMSSDPRRAKRLANAVIASMHKIAREMDKPATSKSLRLVHKCARKVQLAAIANAGGVA